MSQFIDDEATLRDRDAKYASEDEDETQFQMEEYKDEPEEPGIDSNPDFSHAALMNELDQEEEKKETEEFNKKQRRRKKDRKSRKHKKRKSKYAEESSSSSSDSTDATESDSSESESESDSSSRHRKVPPPRPLPDALPVARAPQKPRQKVKVQPHKNESEEEEERSKAKPRSRTKSRVDHWTPSTFEKGSVRWFVKHKGEQAPLETGENGKERISLGKSEPKHYCTAMNASVEPHVYAIFLMHQRFCPTLLVLNRAIVIEKKVPAEEHERRFVLAQQLNNQEVTGDSIRLVFQPQYFEDLVKKRAKEAEKKPIKTVKSKSKPPEHNVLFHNNDAIRGLQRMFDDLVDQCGVDVLHTSAAEVMGEFKAVVNAESPDQRRDEMNLLLQRYIDSPDKMRVLLATLLPLVHTETARRLFTMMEFREKE